MNSLNLFHKLSAAVCLIVLLGMMWSCGAALSRAATTTPSKAFGTVTEYHNPIRYVVATVVDGEVWEDAGKYFTQIDIKPLGTPLTYSDRLILCGDQGKRIFAIRDTVALAYKTSASGMTRGFSCHDLLGIYGVKP